MPPSTVQSVAETALAPAQPSESFTSLTVRSRRASREGRWWLITAVLLWGIGLYRGINLLSFLGILMAVAWTVNYWMVRRRLDSLRVRRWLGTPPFAGTPFGVHLELVNAGSKTERGIRLRDQGPEHDACFFAVELPPGGRRLWRHEITVPCRGRYETKPLIASNGYPLGLTERVVSTPGAGDTLVIFPRLFHVHRGRLRYFLDRAAGGAGRPRGRPQPHPTAQTEFHGLRPFRIGDSPRLIHWKTSARRSALMVREFEDTPTDNLVLVVDPSLPKTAEGTGRSPAELRELALSLAATICDAWCRQSQDQFVFALAGPEPIVLAGTTGTPLALRMFEALALVGEVTPEQLGALVHRVASTTLPPGPVLVVSAAPSTLNSALAGRLHRPVAALDPLTAQEYELVDWERDDAS